MHDAFMKFSKRSDTCLTVGYLDLYTDTTQHTKRLVPVLQANALPRDSRMRSSLGAGVMFCRMHIIKPWGCWYISLEECGGIINIDLSPHYWKYTKHYHVPTLTYTGVAENIWQRQIAVHYKFIKCLNEMRKARWHRLNKLNWNRVFAETV